MEKDYLILKRASASRPSGEWNDDDYDVLAGRGWLAAFSRRMRHPSVNRGYGRLRSQHSGRAGEGSEIHEKAPPVEAERG